ncbi:MAG TPA: hypothetical protein VFK05_27420 [Polyangiaceae bacterium]|nr:hypothetical protein [Polyangiaceae bacterium]
MKLGHLASGFGLCLWLSACAAQGPEPNAPAASAPSSTSPNAEERPATPESSLAQPAPAPPAEPQGLDAKKKVRVEDAEFSNLEAAERALNQAKADLDRLAIAEPPTSLGRSESNDRAAEKKPGKATAAPSAPSAAGAAASPKTSVCEEACRAFSSLARAANAVCRLDGNGGTHCSRAKHVLEGAQQRVASCSCPTASD